MKKFNWNENTKYEEMPLSLIKLIPDCTNLDDLDGINQVEHVRFRVQHEIDIVDEEGFDGLDIIQKEYLNALKFIKLTASN